jgi:hypothetical protein
MTTRQTKYANGQRSVPYPKDAGGCVSVRASYDIVSGQDPALIAATDRIEMFILPAFCTVDEMIFYGVSGAAGTCNIGLMSGTAGDPDVANARTVGVEFFSAVSNNAAQTRMILPTGFDIAPVDYDRGVGLTVSADITQGAGRYLRIKAIYSANIL